MKALKIFLKFWLPPVLYAVLIFYLSSLEEPFGIEFESGNIDKVIHFFEYAIFGFLLIRAIRGSDVTVSINTALLITFIIGTFYGFTDELHQSVVPGRLATVSDFLFDSLGTFVGAMVFTLRRQKVR